jgi:hypothetical protein
MESSQRAAVYISYSGKDPYWGQIIISALDKAGLEVLHGDNLGPEDAWHPDLSEMREKAGIAILVVSQNFLDSHRIQSEELPHLLHLRQTRNLQVISVLVGESRWQTVAPLREMKTFPEDGKPLQRGMEARTHMQMQALAKQVVDIAESLGRTAASKATITPVPPIVAKAFGARMIALNRTTTLTFTISNPNPNTNLTDIGFADLLPAGLVLSSPNGLEGSWADGELNAEAGSNRITLSRAVLPAGGSCNFQLSVTGISEGTKNNTTHNITSKESGNGGTASASITVTAAPLETSLGAQTSGVAQPPVPSSFAPVPFDLGKYQFSIGATTILKDASAHAIEKEAPVSTSLVLLEIIRKGKPGRERYWAADFLLDALSAQPGKFQQVMAKHRGGPGKQQDPTSQQESGPRLAAKLMKPGLAWSLNRAQEIATGTTGEVTIGTRHLLAALIGEVPPPYTLGAQRLLAEMDVDVPLLRQRMYEWARGYGDDDRHWRVVLIGAGTEPRRRVEFSADSTTGTDLIGIEQDVLALATLIAARDSSPPLSIGLFGDWGSGKTFFMGQLRSTIAQFSKEARDASVVQRELPFYKRIVQIDFNAWHYVEGNLWASMVEHILENLRISEDQELTITEKLQKHWIAKLGFSETAVAEADKKKTEAAAKVCQAQIEVQKAAAAHKEKTQLLQELSRKNAARAFQLSGAFEVITTSLEPLGLKPMSNAVTDLQSSLRQARSVVEGGSAVFASLLHAKDRKSRWLWLLIILAGAPIAAALIRWFLERLGYQHIADISQYATSVAGVLTFGAGWIRKQAQWVAKQAKRVEEAQRTYDTAFAKELAATADQITKTEQELALARQDYTLAKQRAEQAMREREAASSDLAAATTTRLLGQFIQDRAASTDYRKHLGVLAIVRQDFQELSKLIEEDNWRLAPEGPDDQRFAGKLKKITNLEEENADAATRINRIVLYIDDLDRCPPAKVVEVLQAVHLLLAFPLFVVVVGVDARWISRSLESRYRELLHFGQADAAVDITEMFGVARSEDYLEKIFQIPLWLRRMDARTAQRMVQGLLGKHIPPPGTKNDDKAPLGTPRPAAPPPVRNAAPLNQSPGLGQEENVPQPLGLIGDVEQSAGTSATPASLPTHPTPVKTVMPNLESLEIRDFELSAIEELAPLLGRSPRALKRFVNLYRLIKAGLTPAEHNAFIRHNQDEVGGFGAVLFLLAIDTGLPRVSRAVFDAFLSMKETDDLSVLLGKVDKQPSANTADWDTLKDWINDLKGTEKLDRGISVIAEWVPRVARYSFQASHGEGSRDL